MATQAERDEILRNADIPGIGSHCDVETCKQLDFLPFDCESCKGTFCLDHRTETAHSCKKAGTWLSSFRPAAAAVTRAPQTLGGAPSACAASRCKTQINTPTHPGVRCPTCRKQFCLAHRLQDSHECRPPPPAAATVAQEKARDALQRFKASWAPKATSSRSSSTGPGMFAGLRKSSGSNSSVAAVAKMKREAKGDEKVASEKRIYLFVEAEARTTTAKIPRGTFWYSKEWTMGRVLDLAAKSLQVTNVNNQADSDDKRLRVFHVEGGRVVNFGERVGDIAVNGNTLVLLRGLQMPDLLQ